MICTKIITTTRKYSIEAEAIKSIVFSNGIFVVNLVNGNSRNIYNVLEAHYKDDDLGFGTEFGTEFGGVPA